MRLETLGALAAFSAAVLAIESRGQASQMGLTLSYALQITSLTSMTVRLASVAENAFNAVERMAEYSNLQEEAPAVVRDSAPPDWPSAGKVRFAQFDMYALVRAHLFYPGLLQPVIGNCMHSKLDPSRTWQPEKNKLWLCFATPCHLIWLFAEVIRGLSDPSILG